MTTENTVKAMAPCLGQKVIIRVQETIERKRVTKWREDFMYCISTKNDNIWINSAQGYIAGVEAKLLLRPLSALTDEEKTEFAKIIRPNETDDYIEKFKHGWVKNFITGSTMYETTKTLTAFDYLRSIGIDLVSIHLDGKTLMASGLAVYENGKQ